MFVIESNYTYSTNNYQNCHNALKFRSHLIITRSIDVTHDLLRAYVQMFIRLTGQAHNRHTLIDILERLSQVNTRDRDIRVSLPGSHHGLEPDNLRVRTGLISIQPRATALIALVFDLAAIGRHAPAAAVLVGQGEAHTAIVSHVAAAIDHHVDVVRVIEGFRATPDHSEGYCYVGGA